jgi:hypothetical protein
VAVVIGLLLGALLTLGTGSPRVLAVKEAAWPAVAGLAVAGSLLRGKPLSFCLFRPLLTGGQAANRPFWDEVWAGGPSFRHCLRTLALWAVILFAATAAELAGVLWLPVSQAGAVPGLVPLAAVPLLLGCTAIYGGRTGLGIRAALAVVRPEAETVEDHQAAR